jgi:hypothetical protein
MSSVFDPAVHHWRDINTWNFFQNIPQVLKSTKHYFIFALDDDDNDDDVVVDVDVDVDDVVVLFNDSIS